MSTKVRYREGEKDLPSPWQAYYHKIQKRVFYWNPLTKESMYTHPAIPEKKDVKLIHHSTPKDAKKSKRKRSVSPEPEIKRTKVTTTPTALYIVRKRPNVPYEECVILDTNILVDNTNIIVELCERNILTVIPYTVITELNGLKNDPKLLKKVNKVCRRIEKLKNEECPYLELESAAERLLILESFEETPNDNDDRILKCGLRVKNELLSEKSDVKIKSITFVTNDTNLRIKAKANHIETTDANGFLNKINCEGAVAQREESTEPEDSSHMPSLIPTIDSDSDEPSRESHREPSPVLLDPNRYTFRQLVELDMETEAFTERSERLPERTEDIDNDTPPSVPVIRRSKSPLPLPTSFQNRQSTQYNYIDNPKLASFLTNGNYKPSYTKKKTTMPETTPPVPYRPIARMPLDDDLNEYQESMDCS